MREMDDRTLTSSEAAAFLGTHVETIRRLVRQKKILGHKVGGTWRFKKRELIGTEEDRYHVEKAVREADTFASKIIDSSSNGIYIHDVKTGNNVYINDYYTKLTGHTLESLNAMSQEAFFALFHPDDQAAVLAHMNDVVHSLNDTVMELEYRFKGVDGNWIWCLSRDTVLLRDDNGNVRQFLGSFVDITELKERSENARRFYDEIANNMAEGVYLIRVNDGVIVYANSRLESMFGYESGEMEGCHVSIVNAPTDKSPQETVSEITAILRKDGIWRGDVKNIKKDGTVFWCHASVSVFDHHEYGNVMISVHTDVTERRQIEEERQRLIGEHQTAMANIKKLEGILPTCQYCKKIRDGEGGWSKIEAYISHHTDAQFSHGICPDCSHRFHPDLFSKDGGIIEDKETGNGGRGTGTA